MMKLRFLFLAVALASSSLAVACGDDDNPNNPGGDAGTDGTTNPPDGGPNPNPDGSTDGGGGDADAGGPQSFPAYVQTLIETKTANTGAPDDDTVWGSLTDDEKFVYPATFFP